MFQRLSTGSNTPSAQRIKELRRTYTEVNPVDVNMSKAQIPLPVAHTMIPDEQAFHGGLQHELSWLQSANDIVVNDENVDDSQFSWAAHHSCQPYCTVPTETAISALLSQFPDQAKSVAMHKKSMNVIKFACPWANTSHRPQPTTIILQLRRKFSRRGRNCMDKFKWAPYRARLLKNHRGLAGRKRIESSAHGS